MKVELEIQSIATVHSLPGIWPPDELRDLLVRLEFPDTETLGDGDLLEMTLMALQDLGHQKAGEAVLEAVFGKAMSVGVRQNLVDDLQDEEPWQDFSNVMQQRGIFVAVVLMCEAFPNRYPNPDVLRLDLVLQGIEPSALDNAALLRLLAKAMAPTGVLRRLYGTELEHGDFPDADGIIWHRELKDNGTLAIISSRQWLGSLERGMHVSARMPDR